jgi:dipeptidyl-peptidase-4
MLMHGMKDDNVFGAHVFRLSDALHSAHRPHTVVPLPTSSHFVTKPDIERQVCRMQADFLRDALRQPAGLSR